MEWTHKCNFSNAYFVSSPISIKNFQKQKLLNINEYDRISSQSIKKKDELPAIKTIKFPAINTLATINTIKLATVNTIKFLTINTKIANH